MGESNELMAGGVAAEAMHCPRCGYDLRGNVGERCSECGWVIDHEVLKGGGFAWVRRRQVGWIRSYWKTVWQVSVDRRGLRGEAGRGQDLAASRMFRRIVALTVAIVLVGMFFLIDGQEMVIGLAVRHRSPLLKPDRPAWVENFAVPWSAGVTMVWVPPVMLVGYAFFFAAVPKRLFRMKDAEASAQQTAQAIVDYAIAPLAWLLPVGVLFTMVFSLAHLSWHEKISVAMLPLAVVVAAAGIWLRVRHAQRGTKANIFVMPAMLVAAGMTFLLGYYLELLSELELASVLFNIAVALMVAAALSLLLTIVRVVQWAWRVKQLGVDQVFVDVPHLIGAWLVGGVTFFGIIPWCIGFAWIVIDSFR